MLLSLQNFRCQCHNFHELVGAQLAGHRSENSRANRLKLAVEQYGSVVVKPDQRSVTAAHTLGSPHHNGVVNLAPLYPPARDGIAHCHLDDIADVGITAL